MENMRKTGRIIAGVCALVLTLTGLCGCMQQEKKLFSPLNPVAITVWNYYNGAQLDSFDALVTEFNETRGKELGITVTGYSQGTVNDLQDNVLRSAEGKVGADEIPNIFAAYADTAYGIDQMGLLVNLADYLTDEQKNSFIEGFLFEGDWSNNGEIKIFPIAKSTELFLLNETDWQVFADATGAKFEDFSTIEGLVDTAQRYYEWTDSLTETPNDGKAFYGRDAMANYMLIGGMQLGCEIFQAENGKVELHFERDVARKLWDCYYIPFIKGYFAASGRFRSDDIKTGNIIAFTGSSSGATFFPKKVITEEAEHEISMRVFAAPQFAGSKGYAVQQGAGMAVTKKSDAEIAASVEFLLWFTQAERNIRFSLGSGYIPVTKDALSMDVIHKNAEDLTPVMDSVLTAAVDTAQNNNMYTTKAFVNGTQARSILERFLSDRAAADRQLVVSLLQKGLSLEEATAEYVSDNHFEIWYQKVLTELNALVK